MSRHASYGKSSKTAKKRNVLKRFERVDVLRRLGKWKDGENLFHMISSSQYELIAS